MGMLFWPKLMVTWGLVMIMIYAANCEELLELSCLTELECKQYAQEGITADCVEHRCSCTNNEGVVVSCKPPITKHSNIIGGHCPCRLSNTECKKEEDICYCADGYMPNHRRRSCMRISVPLGSSCQQDEQCQVANRYSVCQADTGKCECQPGFVAYEGTCYALPTIGNEKHNCTEDKQCKHLDMMAKCATQAGYCVCAENYVIAADRSACVELVKYKERCRNHQQCQWILGPNSKCNDGACECAEKYVAVDTDSQNTVNGSFCTQIAVRGQYCRTHSDCYEHQKSEETQSLQCHFGECICLQGLNHNENNECISGNTKASPSIMLLWMSFGISILQLLHLELM